MIASYQGNENIKNYTLKGYAKALGAYFKESSKEDDPKNITTVKVSEVVIDKIKFYLISSTLTFTEKKYAYTLRLLCYRNSRKGIFNCRNV